MEPARDRRDAPEWGGNVTKCESHEAHVPAACEGRRPRRSSLLEERLAWVVEKYSALGFALPGGSLEGADGIGPRLSDGNLASACLNAWRALPNRLVDAFSVVVVSARARLEPG